MTMEPREKNVFEREFCAENLVNLLSCKPNTGVFRLKSGDFVELKLGFQSALTHIDGPVTVVVVYEEGKNA